MQDWAATSKHEATKKQKKKQSKQGRLFWKNLEINDVY